jgi:hypothetical protein
MTGHVGKILDRIIPQKPVMVKIATIIRMPSTGPEKTPRYNWPDAEHISIPYSEKPSIRTCVIFLPCG